MASRVRTIYNTEALFAGPSPATGSHFSAGQVGAGGTISSQLNSGTCLVSGLNRIQSINYSFSYNRTPVNQYGELASIDRIILDSPTVNLDFNYLVQSLYNEKLMGFSISTGTSLVSCVSGFLNKSTDERNYFIRTFQEGQDAVNNTDRSSNVYTIGIGNAFINNYSAQGSVGGFPTASVSVEALNFKIDSCTGSIPAINPVNGTPITSCNYDLPNFTSNPTGNSSLTISALRPGDISLNIGTYSTAANGEPGVLISDWKAQSYNVGVGLSRTPILKLGSKYAFSREINFPATATASFTAKLGDLKTGNISDFINVDTDYNLEVSLNSPGTSTTIVKYMLYGANLDSQSFSSSIGSDKQITLNFSAQLAGPSQTGVGLFISGYS